METDPLWTLIAGCRRQGLTGDQRDAWLRAALTRQSLDGIIGFQAGLEQRMAESRTWSLWAAADRVFGGWCSDDTFCWFRHWLVGLGRPVFEAAVRDPDSLAYVPEVLRLSGLPRETWRDDRPAWESLDRLAPEAYERVAALPADALDAAVRAKRISGAAGGTATLHGPRWSALDEPEAARRLPRLSEMFPLPAA
ncbi:DUF4240 domain-containing protein [Actinacidiphila acidipaludis]|uniref:DUF4240 domain-containing protein n=1 Tax=Actinacidiphila acidipaludis TaxID=2873382 RepID=A0ABS7QCS6_9ACTN|nr:DUF4240 domain-containing protein [Streptomyces acidipaludis]MBY8879782.1 DUF4240 domain-containing protein [Streptomyces acidipaludis]